MYAEEITSYSRDTAEKDYQTMIAPPRIHNLLRLAEKSDLQISDEQANELDMLTTFNINARYPDYKQSIYWKSTEAFTAKHIEKIKELRSCLHSELDKI